MTRRGWDPETLLQDQNSFTRGHLPSLNGRQIASARFDWHSALSDLSKVVPANTSLQSLLGTVAPGATVSGAGGVAGGGTGASTSSVRALESGPAFELKGCTSSHDDVARLMSRLRLLNEVTRVTLTDSQKPDQGGVGSAIGTASSSPGGGSFGCGKDRPFFDAVVFFTPIPNAGPAGLASGSGSSGSPGATGSTSSTPAPGASTSTTPSGTSTTGSSSSSSSSQQVSNASSGGSK